MNYKVTLEKKTDEEIIKIIRNGNKQGIDKLIERYQKLVKTKASKYFMYGSDENDVYQEGLIGLYKAIQNFDEKKVSSFKTFANLCIERQLISAIKSSNRLKHFYLNNALSLNNTFDNKQEDVGEIANILKDSTIEDPLDSMIHIEYISYIKNTIYKKLSDREKKVLREYIKGKSYIEIAQTLNCSTKSVDTALTRIKRKAIYIQDDYNNL